METFPDISAAKSARTKIRLIVESRIKGTGVHLTRAARGKILISIRGFRVWGIRKILDVFVSKVTRDLAAGHPATAVNPDIELIEANIKKSAEIYMINPVILEKELQEPKKEKDVWNSLDADMCAALLINAFMLSFEKSAIDMIEKRTYPDRNLIKLLERDRKEAPEITYCLEDFGFVFRARIYAYWINSVYPYLRGGKVIKRLDEILSRLYREYFIEGKKRYGKNSGAAGSPVMGLNIAEKNKTAVKSDSVLSNIKSSSVNGEQDEKLLKELSEALSSENSTEILKALEIIRDKKLDILSEKLKELFSHPDEKVMNTAFDVYMEIMENDISL